MGNHVSRRAYLAGTTAATLTGLSGCTLFGGGDSGDGTITIGATVPETGPFSALGEDLKRGYQLGINRMNEGDGIQGQEVELVVRDDESDPQQVQQQLQTIISNNQIDMLWGSFSSLLVPAGSSVAEQEGLPFVAIAASYEQNRLDTNADWTFIPFPHSRDIVRGTGNVLGQIPDDVSRVAIWEPNSGWGNEMATQWSESLTSAGYDIVYEETYEIGASDFSSLISQTADAGAEILISNPTPQGGITAMQQIRDAGYAPNFVLFVRAADPFSWWSALGETGRSVCMMPGWVPGLTGNGNDRLYQSFRSEYDAADDEYPPVMVGASYNLTQVAEQALTNADSVEPAAVQSVLQSETFSTVVGEFGFDDVGRPREGEITVPVGQWRDGQQRLVDPQTDHPASMDLQYPITPWSER